jgi:hypothetical protein
VKPRRHYATVWCPAPDCKYGETGGKAVFRALRMGDALRAQRAHVVSCHPDFKPPSGSMADRIPKLD